MGVLHQVRHGTSGKAKKVALCMLGAAYRYNPNENWMIIAT